MTRAEAGTTPHADNATNSSDADGLRCPSSLAGADVPDPTATTAVAELRASLQELLAAGLRHTFGIALDKVEELASTLDTIASHGGPGINALLGGTQAHLEGRNRFWGAATRAVSSLSPAAKAALVCVLTLALILLPATVLLVLLALIVCVVLISLSSR